MLRLLLYTWYPHRVFDAPQQKQSCDTAEESLSLLAVLYECIHGTRQGLESSPRSIDTAVWDGLSSARKKYTAVAGTAGAVWVMLMYAVQ